MVIVTKNELENGIFSTTVKVKEFGTAELTAEEEKAKLDDFSNKIVYKNVKFERNIKTAESQPIVTDSEADGTNVVKVGLAMNNQEYVINENFSVTYRVDVKKILDSEKNNVLPTAELVCQAKCLVFATAIKEELERIVEAALTRVVGFEGEIEDVIPDATN